jgi:carbon storage regulator
LGHLPELFNKKSGAAMLVVSRKSQEFLQIGDQILIKIIKTTNGSVKIGIEAPGSMRVLRGELIEDLQPASLLPRTKRPASLDACETEGRQIAEAL